MTDTTKKPAAPKAKKAEPELVAAEPLAVDAVTGETPDELKPEEEEEGPTQLPDVLAPAKHIATGAKWRGFTAERRARRKGITL